MNHGLVMVNLYIIESYSIIADHFKNKIHHKVLSSKKKKKMPMATKTSQSGFDLNQTI